MQMQGTVSSIGMGMQQHQQYPGINSIPGMHPISNMNGMQNMQTLQGMSGMPSFPSLPGITTMQSLIPPPQEATNHSHSLSTNHVSTQFNNAGVASGGIERRRRARRNTRDLTYGAALMSGDDATTMMMAAQHAAQVAHADPVGSLTAATPVYEADGIQFKLLEQLPDTKIQRLRTEKIKPIENLTFNDIKAYNRNQLRAYCSVYGIRRKKKAEMEKDMARYAALFHPNDLEFDWRKFEPTEYAEGPIPRRKTPVTKEQKEAAAGDFKRLTGALQQRPQPSTLPSQEYPSATNSHHTLTNTHHSSHYHGAIAPPRLPDLHGGSHNTVHTGQHHLGSHHGNHHEEHDSGPAVGVSAAELMPPVPEMHVPNHLLGISHQIGEE